MPLCARLGVVVALLIAAFSSSAGAQVPQSERDALIAFYNSTGGNSWTVSTGWNGAAGTECAWFGIECDANSSHVVGISLDGNNLTGNLPSISALTSLTYLVVPNNQLRGTIPALSGMAALSIFNAYNNQLSGSIPSLAGLTNLTQVYLLVNQLTGALPAFSGLTNLVNFDASYNQLSGSIPSLAGLVNLQQLYLGFNQLSGTIPAFTGLAALQDIGLDDNQLSGSIPPLAALSNLRVFTASGNRLSGSIPSLAGLSNLIGFGADTNQLTGSIPALSGSPLLQVFSVSENGLSGPIPSLTGLVNLNQINASYNSLTGPIPSLTGLEKLQLVYLGFNQIGGSIPSLTGLGELQDFIVDDNQLTGSLPSLAGLNNLVNFNAYNNALTGSIPALQGLSKLYYFSVAANQLSGSLPQLAGLTSLAVFDASYNKASGTIPSLNGLSNLQQFYLGFNQLTGTIPSLTGLGNLQDFAVDDNNLSGPLPALSALGNLQNFLAASNQLSGSIPALTGLTNLQSFQIGNNRLSGAIPAVPAPDRLESGLSSLCPNALIQSDDVNWDAATGLTPWYSTCASDESTTANNAPTVEDSTNLALSGNGTVKVFQSKESGLVAGNANANGQDIYSVNGDGRPVLENIDSGGHQMIGTASLPAVSSDGNVVAFLFTPTTGQQAKDVVTGQIFAGPLGQPKHQVDMGMGSVPPNGAANGAPSLSSVNGVNQLAFCSAASNLVPSDANNGRDVFLVDPLNPAIVAQRISVDATGNQLPGDSCEPKLSSDGTRVVFSLSAPSLFSTPARQIVRKDLPGAGKALFTGQFLPITTTSTGQGATADSSEPTINQDGSVVAFTSQANLDGLGAPFNREVFVSLPIAGSSRLIRRMRSDSTTIAGFASQHPQISDNGTTVVMQIDSAVGFAAKSLAKAVDGTVANQCGAVAITTNFFSATPLGGELCSATGATVNQNPSISGDGVTTGFDSNASQGDSTANFNAYSQGIGANTDITGNSVANLSGDFSGQWFDPNQSGQGLVIDVTNPDANNGRLMILTWFVFSGGQPTWVQGVGVPKAGVGSAANTVVVQMDQVAIFQGVSFPLGAAHATGSVWGSIALTFTDANTGTMRWTSGVAGFGSGSMPIKHFLSVGLPSQDAPGAQIKSCFSGNWFNPAQSGHGFEFEVLGTSPPFLAVDWFAFAPSGAPVWLQGVGQINGNSAQMQLQLIDGTGAQFPPNFNPAQITQHVWGTATFTFTDSAHATVSWNSSVPGYGSGSQPLQPIVTGLMDRRACH